MNGQNVKKVSNDPGVKLLSVQHYECLPGETFKLYFSRL